MEYILLDRPKFFAPNNLNLINFYCNNMNKIISMICICFIISSCATQRASFDGRNYYSSEDVPTYKQTDNFFIGGIGQTKVFIDAEEKCTEKGLELSRVEFKQTFQNILLTAITLGIYSPRDLEIYCK